MSATTDKICQACGELHTFYLAVGDHTAATKQYDYVCPTKNKKTVFQDGGESWRVVPLRPNQTVMIVETSK